jgi:hypothetical protein
MKVTLHTQEIQAAGKVVLMDLYKQHAHVAIAPHRIEEMPETKVTDSKWTPSQKLRFALHDYFVKTHNGDPSDKAAFNKFYEEEILHLVRLVNDFNDQKNERGFW